MLNTRYSQQAQNRFAACGCRAPKRGQNPSQSRSRPSQTPNRPGFKGPQQPNRRGSEVSRPGRVEGPQATEEQTEAPKNQANADTGGMPSLEYRVGGLQQDGDVQSEVSFEHNDDGTITRIVQEHDADGNAVFASYGNYDPQTGVLTSQQLDSEGNQAVVRTYRDGDKLISEVEGGDNGIERQEVLFAADGTREYSYFGDHGVSHLTDVGGNIPVTVDLGGQDFSYRSDYNQTYGPNGSVLYDYQDSQFYDHLVF